MKVLCRNFFNVARGDEWRLYPLGDVHLGNAGCDEAQFRAAVRAIEQDDQALWVGMGDYADFINVSDPRFSSDSLASWVKMPHLADLAGAQAERFLDIVAPIAGKCLGLIEGNHERSIQKHYERSIYSEVVSGVKARAGFDAGHNLAFGYSGWLVMRYYRSEDKQRCSVVKVNMHHGAGGGRLAGGKALNMQRWLWTHDADLVIFGHSHNSAAQVEAVESVSGERVVQTRRIGIYSGTFLDGAHYAEEKAYLPMAVTQSVVVLRPGAADSRDRISVIARM